MTTPKYRTDARACSCPDYWYRRTCRHWRAYREAVTLVQAQDAANVTWDTRRGSRGGSTGLSESLSEKETRIPGKLPGIGEPREKARVFGLAYRKHPIGVNLAPIMG